VRITHNDRITGADETFFREQSVADAVGTYIEEVPDAVPPGPVAQDLGLGSGLAVLAGSDVIYDGFDFGRVKNPVFSAMDQIVNGNGGGDLMAEYGIQAKNFGPGERLINQMRFKYFFGSCFTHVCSSLLVCIVEFVTEYGDDVNGEQMFDQTTLCAGNFSLATVLDVVYKFSSTFTDSEVGQR